MGYNNPMKCTKCQGTNLILIPWGRLEYLCDLVQGKWVYRDPGVKGYFFSSRRVSIRCLDCHHDTETTFPETVYSPKITKEEITFDLDHTLFYCDPYGEDRFQPDFEFTDPDGKYTYKVSKRPHLDELIQFCVKRFKKINVFTAATDWYGKILFNSLNIPEEKRGYFKHRGDTRNERPLTFEWEYMKYMDDSLMVEDKPFVVKGKQNRVIKVNSYFPGVEDNELLRVMEVIQKEDEVFTRPQLMRGKINLFLQNWDVAVKDIPEEVINEVLKVTTLTQEEIDKLPVHTSPFESYWTMEQGEIEVSTVGLNYENYVKLMALLKNYTDQKPLTKIKFNRLVKDRNNWRF